MDVEGTRSATMDSKFYHQQSVSWQLTIYCVAIYPEDDWSIFNLFNEKFIQLMYWSMNYKKMIWFMMIPFTQDEEIQTRFVGIL